MKFISFLPLLLLTACSIVNPGERGIRISLGSVSQDTKEPGAYFWIPFIFGMAKINVQIQKSDIDTSAASKDMQEITTHIAVNWSITPNTVVKMYQEIGDQDDVLRRIISPAASEALKAAASKKTAEEILTKRTELKTEIDNSLKERLARYGVTLEDVSIVNLTFSPEFTKAIESKQIAEQQAKQAEYDAQKAVQTAKAEVNRARGQAEAQSLLKASLTREMLDKLAIEKWDGRFPQVMGSQSVPFINITPHK